MGIRVLSPGLSARAKFLIVGSIVVVVMASFVYLPPDRLIMRFAQLSSAEEITAEGRLLWRETLDLIAAYPLFGCGLGGYGSAFLKYIKALLRDAYQGLLPDEVLSGRKMGFEVPLQSWLEDDWRALLLDTIGARTARVC